MFGTEQLEECGYLTVKKSSIRSAASTEYRRVTDGWMDRQTKGQTSSDSIIRAMHRPTRRAVKIVINWEFLGNMLKLKMHSVERIYLRQRCFDASKPRVATSTSAQYGFSRRNKIPRCSAYAMGESNLVPASGL